MNPKQDFIEAIEKYNPVRILALFSGGHDSLCSTHYTFSLLKSKGIDIPVSVYHGDTGTGIQETQDYVKSICQQYGWELDIRKPVAPYDYESYVKKYGFPGPAQHMIMYRNLKEKPLRKYVTHEIKTSPYARENVLLVTGIRSSESVIRMGYKDSVRKEGSRVWTCPIMDWKDSDINGWIKSHNLPRNPVKDRICISGECLCGCFAKPEERAEISREYADAWERLQQLATFSKWGWGTGGKSRYEKHNPPGQINMFMPMCVGCETKKMTD